MGCPVEVTGCAPGEWVVGTWLEEEGWQTQGEEIGHGLFPHLWFIP